MTIWQYNCSDKYFVIFLLRTAEKCECRRPFIILFIMTTFNALLSARTYLSENKPAKQKYLSAEKYLSPSLCCTAAAAGAWSYQHGGASLTALLPCLTASQDQCHFLQIHIFFCKTINFLSIYFFKLWKFFHCHFESFVNFSANSTPLPAISSTHCIILSENISCLTQKYFNIISHINFTG